MTGEKRTGTRMGCCIPYYHSTTLPTVIHNACREGWSDIQGIHRVLASHSCFCSFFISHPYILSKYLHLFSSLYPFYQPHMHAHISMSEREDRSMIAHACDECTRRVLFSSDIIIVGTI